MASFSKRLWLFPILTSFSLRFRKDKTLPVTVPSVKPLQKLKEKLYPIPPGITCAHINNINTYELVVFVQDYLDYIQSTSSTGVPTKQTLHCLYNRLNVYLKLKATLPLLNKMEAEGTNRINEATLPLLNKMDVDSTNRINGLSEHELRAFGNTVALFTTEEIVGSRYLEQIVEMLGRNPREQLDVLKPRADFEIILEKYFEKVREKNYSSPLKGMVCVGGEEKQRALERYIVEIEEEE
jgi:hypothetical protein